MYSSSSPHELDAFAGLDIGDDYDMAPRTRQQTRAGVHYSEGQFYYTVNVQRPDGSSAQVLHSYDLPFEPENPNPLRDAISYQGRNISYDIKASQAGGRIQFDFMERVSVWVNSVNNPPILQCNCSHQLQDEACKVGKLDSSANTLLTGAAYLLRSWSDRPGSYRVLRPSFEISADHELN